MTPAGRILRWLRLGFALVAGLAPGSAWAKAPVLDRLFPPGGQRGRTTEVTAEGQFDTWPPRVWVEGRGIEVRPGEAKGKLAVTVAPDASGVGWIRLHDDQGASEPRPFLVGSLPEAVEVEPNDSPAALQAVAARALTINGRLAKNGDVDGYAVTLEAGQTLVAALQAHEVLGSPMDAVLQVARPDGLVLDQADDSAGLDPRLVFVAPRAGAYVVRTFAFPAEPSSSIQFAGGAAFLYRLTLTADAFADHPWPLSVPRDRPGWVGVVGWNLPDDARTLAVFPTAAAPDHAWADHPALAAPVSVRVVPRPVVLESPPLGPDPIQAITAPVSLAGRIAAPGERDVYRFRSEAGKAHTIRVAARSLGFPLDPVLRVLDSGGKVLAESDDSTPSDRDPELRFAPPAAGEYRVEVRDLNDHAGPRHLYQLDLLPADPEVRLALAQRQFTLTAEAPLEITVAVDRRNGFAGRLSFAVEGLPDWVAFSRVRSVPGDASAKKVVLTLTSHGTSTWSGPFRVVGHPDPPDPAFPTGIAIEADRTGPRLPWMTALRPDEARADPPCFQDW